MPKEVATALISFFFGIALMFVGLAVHSLLSTRVNVEYTLDMARQITVASARYLPNSAFVDHVQSMKENTIKRMRENTIKHESEKYFDDDDDYFLRKLVAGKEIIESLRQVEDLNCAAFIEITNKSETKASNITIVGRDSPGMIAEGERYSFRSYEPIPKFDSFPGKYNIGDLLPNETRSYVLMSNNAGCGIKAYRAAYLLTHDQGVAYLDEFPRTYFPLNLALRHEYVSVVLILIALYAITMAIFFLVQKLFSLVSVALRTSGSTSEVGQDGRSEKS